MTTVAENTLVRIDKITLGPYDTNAYAIVNKLTNESILVDAPAEPEKLLEFMSGTSPKYVFMTHSHKDHTGGLQGFVRKTFVDIDNEHRPIPCGANLADMPGVPLACHMRLGDGEFVRLGEVRVNILGTPGHTPGSICLRVGSFLLVGDTVFPGGPGHTNSPAAFKEIVHSITEKILTLPDGVRIFPGHGPDTTVGEIRAEYKVFAAKIHVPNLCGDVTWLKS
ncbi:MAG: MBL fold metallo-hydrolase [Chloroflexota bacterium]